MEQEKKLTKKQKRLIAKMWAGAFVSTFEYNELSAFMSIDEAEEICELANQIAFKIIGNHPLIGSLPEIIKYAKSK